MCHDVCCKGTPLADTCHLKRPSAPLHDSMFHVDLSASISKAMRLCFESSGVGFLDCESLVRLAATNYAPPDEALDARWRAFQERWTAFLEEADSVFFTLGTDCEELAMTSFEDSDEAPAIHLDFHVHLTCTLRLTRFGECTTTREFFFSAGTQLTAKILHNTINMVHLEPLPREDLEVVRTLWERKPLFDLFGYADATLAREAEDPGSTCLLDLVGDCRFGTALKACSPLMRFGPVCRQAVVLHWDA